MKQLIDTRPARGSLEEGISLIPYGIVYQRLHRRRWAIALAGLTLLGIGVWAARRR
jgi:hypothetical protein